MFPEIARDDIFHLETERLWLRWPRASDVAILARSAGDVEAAATYFPYDLQDAERFVRTAREDNAAGAGLHLALTLKRQRHEPIGVVFAREDGGRRSLSAGFWLARPHRGQGLMAEAMFAFLDLLFKITTVDQIVSAAPGDARASRLYEKLGFEAAGGEDGARARAVLKRGMAHTAFGARRPKLLST